MRHQQFVLRENLATHFALVLFRIDAVSAEQMPFQINRIHVRSIAARHFALVWLFAGVH